MFSGWFKGIFANRKPVSAEDVIKEYIEGRFAKGVDELPIFDIRTHLRSKGYRLTVRMISLYAHDLGFCIKRTGPEGKYYILPRRNK